MKSRQRKSVECQVLYILESIYADIERRRKYMFLQFYEEFAWSNLDIT